MFAEFHYKLGAVVLWDEFGIQDYKKIAFKYVANCLKSYKGKIKSIRFASSIRTGKTLGQKFAFP